MFSKTQIARLVRLLGLILTFILVQNLVFAQDLVVPKNSAEIETAFAHLKQSEASNGPKFNKKAQDFLEKYGQNCSPDLKADVSIMLGRSTLSMGQPEACLQHLENALSNLDPKAKVEQDAYATCYLLKGQCLASMGDYALAKTSLNHLLETLEDNPKAVANATANLGAIATFERNLSLSRTYIEAAIQMGTRAYGPDHPMIANCYNNLAGIEMELGNLDQEAAYLRKCIAIKEAFLGPKSPALTTNYINLAENAAMRGQFQSAIQLAKNAEAILRNSAGPSSSELRLLLINLATYYAQTKQLDAALACLSEVKEMQATYFDPKDSQTTSANLHAANAYIELGMPAEAKALLQAAANNIQPPKFASNNFLLVRQMENLFNYLSCQQDYFRLVAKTNPIYLDSLELSLFQSLDLLEFELQVPSENSDRILNTEASYSLFESLINLLYQRGPNVNAAKIFELMESSKSRILRESVLNSNAEKFSKLPDSLLEKANSLDEEIFVYQSLAFPEEAKSLHSGHIQAKADMAHLIALREEKRMLIQHFKAHFPAYFEMRYSAKVNSITEIQQQLPKETALLEYFEGDTSIFVFCIQATSSKLLRIPKTPAFKQQIHDFRIGLEGYAAASDRDPRNYERLSKLYATAAFQLYTDLVAPFEASLPHKLIVVPDGLLHYIPFDALLSQLPRKATDFRSHAYLLNKHQISYQNSATLWAKSKDIPSKKKKAKGALAFAPEFAPLSVDEDSIVSRVLPLSPLQNNEAEADAVHQIWSGQLMKGQAANRSNFKALAGNFDIIHLATHAKSNDDNGDFSFVAFSSENATNDTCLLYAHDLYGLELDAEIVVLSACETGLGELRRGEGMLSLSRGFIYAGVKSTVTSLWAVNDARTMPLMQDFHRFLKQGKEKDEALRLAKLNYLENSDHPHPYYWAAFVPLGDMKPMASGNTALLWVLLLFLGLLSIYALSKH